MPEKPWSTIVAVSCDNPALKKRWRDVEDGLYAIVARCGWDTNGVAHKLEEINYRLRELRDQTVDMRLPPSKRFKNG